jgi:23S rRNA pseudouridine1911/1915/1917 synthase
MNELPTLIENDLLDAEAEHEINLVIAPDAEGRLDAWLASQVPELSRARIQALMKEGRITCEGEPVKATHRPKPGSTIRILIPIPVSAIPQPEAIPLTIIYEDADILVLDKQAGLVAHPAPGHLTGTLVNALLHHCKDLAGIGGVERPGIVHRLDKDTSGLMVVAKNDASMAGFVKLFQTGGMTKNYLTLVHGAPLKAKGVIQNLIGRHPVDRKKMAIVTLNGRVATTHYSVERKFKAASLIRCRIETGRTHQIRVHMHALGCPVLGDVLYGRPAADKLLPVIPQRQMLHAAQLAFNHPVTGVALAFESALPEDFATVLASLE